MGLLEPKPEPVDEVPTPHEFMYRRKGVFDEEPLNVALPSLAGEDFEAFLRRTAKEILDHMVRDVISELDRIIFDEETSDVTV